MLDPKKVEAGEVLPILNENSFNPYKDPAN
jgi:hypothetical protein